MANSPEIVVRIDWMFSEEQFAGEQCATCHDCIYGTGLRMVVTTKTFNDLLPKFSETKVILCTPCKDAMK